MAHRPRSQETLPKTTKVLARNHAVFLPSVFFSCVFQRPLIVVVEAKKPRNPDIAGDDYGTARAMPLPSWRFKLFDDEILDCFINPQSTTFFFDQHALVGRRPRREAGVGFCINYHNPHPLGPAGVLVCQRKHREGHYHESPPSRCQYAGFIVQEIAPHGKKLGGRVGPHARWHAFAERLFVPIFLKESVQRGRSWLLRWWRFVSRYHFHCLSKRILVPRAKSLEFWPMEKVKVH